MEDAVTEGLRWARQEKSVGILDGQADPSEWQKTMMLLFRHQVVSPRNEAQPRTAAGFSGSLERAAATRRFKRSP